MDCILEFLFEIIFTPIMYFFIGGPIFAYTNAIKESKLAESKKEQLRGLLTLVWVLIFVGGTVGGFLLGIGESEEERISGIVILSIAGVLFVGYIIFAVACLIIIHNIKKRKELAINDTPDKSIIGKSVHVVIDRPLGSTHPKHDDIIYGVNYGFVPEYIGGDGEEQDAYVLGVDTPLSEFDGVVTAIIQRLDDNEDKWIVVPDGVEISDDEIINRTYFQEQYFQTRLIRDRNIVGDISWREKPQTPKA